MFTRIANLIAAYKTRRLVRSNMILVQKNQYCLPHPTKY